MLFFTGALFFSLAALTRRMAPVYVGAVVLVLGLPPHDDAHRRTSRTTRSRRSLDPFGFVAFGVTTRYWTPAEQNRDLAPALRPLRRQPRALDRRRRGSSGARDAALPHRRSTSTVAAGATTTRRRPTRSPFPHRRGPTPTAAGWARAAVGFAWMYFNEILRSAVFWALIVSGRLLRHGHRPRLEGRSSAPRRCRSPIRRSS